MKTIVTTIMAIACMLLLVGAVSAAPIGVSPTPTNIGQIKNPISIKPIVKIVEESKGGSRCGYIYSLCNPWYQKRVAAIQAQQKKVIHGEWECFEGMNGKSCFKIIS